MRANQTWVASAARNDARLCSKFADPIIEAEDIASDSWFRVHQKVCGQYTANNFKGWMRVIIRHTASDACRKAKPQSGGDPPPPPTDHRTSAEFWKNLTVALSVCLKKLKQQAPKNYEVFCLRFIDNLSLKKTVEVAGLNDEQEASNRLNRAKQFLTHCLMAEMSL